jgi:hypothetical protein
MLSPGISMSSKIEEGFRGGMRFRYIRAWERALFCL